MTALEPVAGHGGHPARRVAAALVGASLLALSWPARSELIEIDWKDDNRFERSVAVAPGKFAELCGPLAAGKTVQWTFDADSELNFNIHYHVGKEVRYPSRMDRVRRSAGDLAVDLAQDYCWMWTNKSAVAAKVAVRLVLK